MLVGCGRLNYFFSLVSRCFSFNVSRVKLVLVLVVVFWWLLFILLSIMLRNFSLCMIRFLFSMKFMWLLNISLSWNICLLLCRCFLIFLLFRFCWWYLVMVLVVLVGLCSFILLFSVRLVGSVLLVS